MEFEEVWWRKSLAAYDGGKEEWVSGVGGRGGWALYL